MTTSNFSSITSEFSENANKAIQVFKIDELIIGFAEGPLKKLKEQKLVRPLGERILDNSLGHLNKIRDNGSLKSLYGIMTNQILVALVSYFESTFSDLFSSAFSIAMRNKSFHEEKLKDKIRLSLGDISILRKLSDAEYAALIMQRLDLKFQNTKNVVANFKDYFGIPEKTVDEVNLNNTICAIELRHAMIHNGGRVDHQLLSNLEKAKPRSLKRNLYKNYSIQMTEDEIKIILESMQNFINTYASDLDSRLSKQKTLFSRFKIRKFERDLSYIYRPKMFICQKRTAPQRRRRCAIFF